MLYLIYFEVPAEVGNRIDFEEGGPGKIIGYIMSRQAPSGIYSGRHAQCLYGGRSG